jgi:hypothetical protein
VILGKEFHDLVVEMWNEVKELGKLSSVNFIMQKLDEVYEKVFIPITGKINLLICVFSLSGCTRNSTWAEN